MLRALDAVAARRWVEDAMVALAEDREAINRINVYPVADGDTGTNLVRTMRSAVDVLVASAPRTAGGVLAAVSKGALSGAQGNSGMLLSQVLRGLAEELRDATEIDGAALTAALARADKLAARAVSDPVEGTLLSVLHAAAGGAQACASQRLDVVVHEATVAAVRALGKTTVQLPALAAAGVVDAGGRGMVILLDTLNAVVSDGQRLAPEPPTAGDDPPSHDSQFSYEVMYLLSGTDTQRTERLRKRLAELGDCVSVVGDGAASWAVHVHCDDIGAAIEAGIELGQVRQIKVLRFADQIGAEAYPVPYAVLACVRGDAVAELFRAEGAFVVRMHPDRAPKAAEIRTAIEATAAAYVVVLPNDGKVAAIAEQAASSAMLAGQEVVVVPTASPVQGLAALAVHDQNRRRADDTVAMAEAAAATRRGELAVAAGEALTWVGRCQPGDVLGLIDDEVVLIADDLVAGARDLAERMLVAGGELMTVLVGADAPAELPAELAASLRRTHPEVELTCYPGGDLGPALLLGVE